MELDSGSSSLNLFGSYLSFGPENGVNPHPRQGLAGRMARFLYVAAATCAAFAALPAAKQGGATSTFLGASPQTDLAAVSRLWRKGGVVHA